MLICNSILLLIGSLGSLSDKVTGEVETLERASNARHDIEIKFKETILKEDE